MRRLGAEKPSFETIVASGERSALPHAHPTGAVLKAGQLVLIDMGAFQDGYASDMTRMLFLGTPGARVKRLYRAVLEAQLAAIDAVRPGVTAATWTARRARCCPSSAPSTNPRRPAPPFVRVGERVQPGKVLCIIESMKLMNEIEAEVAASSKASW
jgi:hypothetical protein